MTLTPSYGRDYKSAKEAREAFESGKDFTIASVGPNMGRQCSIRDLRGSVGARAAVSEVTIRYAKLRKAVVVAVK